MRATMEAMKTIQEGCLKFLLKAHEEIFDNVFIYAYIYLNNKNT